MRAIDQNDPRPPSVQISDDLRSQIEDGELGQGVRLPSGRTLAERYGVALMTAQSAVQRLRDEELVYSTPRGYFVGKAPEASGTDQRLKELEEEVRDLRSRVESLESDR